METLTNIETEVKEKELNLKTYYCFGFSGDHLNTPFIIVSKYKTPPFALKGLRIIWVLGAVNTDKPVNTKYDYEPTVGDIGNTHQREIIEIITVKYF